jgi:hypothetical protein
MHAALRDLLLAGLLTIAPVLALATDTPNSLIATITEAPDASGRVGAQVTLTGLTTKHPTMVWPDGHDETMSKLIENETLLVLQFVGAAGSTDTVYVEKKYKRFVVVSVGVLFATKEAGTTVSVYRGVIK